MSRNLIVLAVWADGDPPRLTRQIGNAVTEVVGVLVGSGGVVSISKAEVERLGYRQLRRDLAVFQLEEAGSPPPE